MITPRTASGNPHVVFQRHGGVVRDVQIRRGGAGVEVLQLDAVEHMLAAEEPGVRGRVTALLEIPGAVPRARRGPERGVGMDAEIHVAAGRSEVEVLGDLERSGAEVEVLLARTRGLPREERILETPDVGRDAAAHESLEVEYVLSVQATRERRAPPVAESRHVRLRPIRAARVDGQRVRALPASEEDRAGVLFEAAGRRLDRDVVRLEVDVPVEAVDSVRRHEPAGPVRGVVVVAFRHGREPLHTVVGLHRVGKDCRAQRHRAKTRPQDSALHVVFLFSF